MNRCGNGLGIFFEFAFLPLNRFHMPKQRDQATRILRQSLQGRRNLHGIGWSGRNGRNIHRHIGQRRRQCCGFNMRHGTKITDRDPNPDQCGNHDHARSRSRHATRYTCGNRRSNDSG